MPVSYLSIVVVADVMVMSIMVNVIVVKCCQLPSDSRFPPCLHEYPAVYRKPAVDYRGIPLHILPHNHDSPQHSDAVRNVVKETRVPHRRCPHPSFCGRGGHHSRRGVSTVGDENKAEAAASNEQGGAAPQFAGDKEIEATVSSLVGNKEKEEVDT